MSLITINVYNGPNEEAMSKLTQRLDDLEAAVNAADGKIAEDVAELRRQIEELKGNVSTPEEEARLADLIARVQAIDPDPNFPAAPTDETPPV